MLNFPGHSEQHFLDKGAARGVCSLYKCKSFGDKKCACLCINPLDFACVNFTF